MSASRTGRLYPQEMLLVLISKRLSRSQIHSAIGRILCQRKIPMTPAGFEPATFRFVAQHLNHCATAVPGHIMPWRSVYSAFLFSYLRHIKSYHVVAYHIICDMIRHILHGLAVIFFKTCGPGTNMKSADRQP